MRSLSKLQKPDVLAVPIATLLRDAIFDRELRLGERIVERQLASQWNVSRAPLREAIRQLTAEGLLVISPHRGTFVRETSERELTELFAVREMIEVNAGRVAAATATESDFTRMQDLVDATKVAAAQQDLSAFRLQGLEFHDELVRLSKNQTLVDIYDGLKLRFRRYQFLLVAVPDLPRSSAIEHEGILNALRAGDGDLAGERIAAHLAHLVARFVAGKKELMSPMVDHRQSTAKFLERART